MVPEQSFNVTTGPPTLSFYDSFGCLSGRLINSLGSSPHSGGSLARAVWGGVPTLAKAARVLRR